MTDFDSQVSVEDICLYYSNLPNIFFETHQQGFSNIYVGAQITSINSLLMILHGLGSWFLNCVICIQIREYSLDC